MFILRVHCRQPSMTRISHGTAGPRWPSQSLPNVCSWMCLISQCGVDSSLRCKPLLAGSLLTVTSLIATLVTRSLCFYILSGSFPTLKRTWRNHVAIGTSSLGVGSLVSIPDASFSSLTTTLCAHETNFNEFTIVMKIAYHAEDGLGRLLPLCMSVSAGSLLYWAYHRSSIAND